MQTLPREKPQNSLDRGPHLKRNGFYARFMLENKTFSRINISTLCYAGSLYRVRWLEGRLNVRSFGFWMWGVHHFRISLPFIIPLTCLADEFCK